jgi:hypothetical protein
MSQVESSPSGTENNDQRGAGAGAAVVKLPEAVEKRKKPFGGRGVQTLWKGILYGED